MTYLFYDLWDKNYNAIDFDNRLSTGWKLHVCKINTSMYIPLTTSITTPEKFLSIDSSFRLIGSLNKYKPTYQDWLEAYPEYFI